MDHFSRGTLSEPQILIVDDDADVRQSLQFLFGSVGLSAVGFVTAREFLEQVTPQMPGCLVLDYRLPGMDGLALLAELERRGFKLPVILLTAHADVPMAVRAMHGGAIDVIQKPFNDQALLERVRMALEQDRTHRAHEAQCELVRQRLASLTRGERAVLDLLCEGKNNKQIAEALGLTRRAIEARRSRVMRKMQAGSLVELVRLALLVRQQ